MVLLCGFVFTGTIHLRVPILYGGAGLAECAIAYSLFNTSLPQHFRDEHLTLPRFVISCVIQMLCIALVPQLAFFFLATLFLVFGFAALGLRVRHAAAVWALVALAFVWIVVQVPEVLVIPHATPLQRGLVAATFMTALARCALVGIFSSHLRNIFGYHLQNAQRSLDSSDEDRTRTATVLHEDLGQDLVGISLMLSACVSRLRRKGEPDAADMELATAQLRTAIQKTRLIATAARPVARSANGLVHSGVRPTAVGDR